VLPMSNNRLWITIWGQRLL